MRTRTENPAPRTRDFARQKARAGEEDIPALKVAPAARREVAHAADSRYPPVCQATRGVEGRWTIHAPDTFNEIGSNGAGSNTLATGLPMIASTLCNPMSK